MPNGAKCHIVPMAIRYEKANSLAAAGRGMREALKRMPPEKLDPPNVLLRPVGRPLASEASLTNEATKPWLALGLSRRTWYRRKAKE